MGNRKWPWPAMQQWDDLLFMHWPISYDMLRSYVPAPLELETYKNQAWISVIPFKASNSRFHNMPGSLSAYLELNIRTYVRLNGEPGVFFFSLDASNPLAVVGARGLFSLPYYLAKMHFYRTGAQIYFKSERLLAKNKNTLSISYCPYPRTYYAKRDSLAWWLTERYVLYNLSGKHILKGVISHPPWLLQDVDLCIEKNEVFPKTNGNPLVHFSKTKKAYFHPFEIVGISL